jgi:molybdopterin-guanine dinucleotide biosynthesis adapter protein
LLSRVIPCLLDQGPRVSVIKDAHHDFDIEVPGKDSWVHRQAGVTDALIGSTYRWALMHERREAEPRLPELLAKMSPVNLVLVEDFKREPIRKIELYRRANGKPSLFPDDSDIVGFVTDADDVDSRLPTVHLDNIEAASDPLQRPAMPLDDVIPSVTAGV